jgi:hypothetical protein
MGVSSYSIDMSLETGKKKKKKEEEEGLTIQSDTFIIYIILVYYLLFRCGLYLNLLERIK